MGAEPVAILVVAVCVLLSGSAVRMTTSLRHCWRGASARRPWRLAAVGHRRGLMFVPLAGVAGAYRGRMRPAQMHQPDLCQRRATRIDEPHEGRTSHCCASKSVRRRGLASRRFGWRCRGLCPSGTKGIGGRGGAPRATWGRPQARGPHSEPSEQIGRDRALGWGSRGSLCFRRAAIAFRAIAAEPPAPRSATSAEPARASWGRRRRSRRLPKRSTSHQRHGLGSADTALMAVGHRAGCSASMTHPPG